MANTDKNTCIRLCLRLRRALGTVLAIPKQAAATAKSSSIFMLIYRYIFRVHSKSKPKKSKLTKKGSSRNEGARLFNKKKACIPALLRICCSKLPYFMVCILNRAVSRRYIALNRAEIAEWFARAILKLQLRRDKNCIELRRQKSPA